MDASDLEQDAEFASVIALLRRERTALSFDEIQRVDRRLSGALAPRRGRRQRSRLAVIICFALGLPFMTAGTGLAISGFATTGAADHAQYPDRTIVGTSKTPASAAPRAGTPGSAVKDRSASRHRAQGDGSRPSNLAGIRPAGRAAPAELRLRQAETRSSIPFTGLAAAPILLVGILFVVMGAGLKRRHRRSD
jgi:hypothetical protein